MACKILINTCSTAYADGLKNTHNYKGAVIAKGETTKQLGILEQDKTKFAVITVSDTVAGECEDCLKCCDAKCDDNGQIATNLFYVKSADVDAIVAAGGSATMTKAELEGKITNI